MDLIEPLDEEKVLAGKQSPMFFGSAMNNFGVELFFNKCLEISTKPRSMETIDAEVSISPNYPEFTGYVFKLQANQDEKHRDRIAFVRVVSGKYEKGMKVTHARSQRQITLSQAQSLFGNEREVLSEAYPGDVSGTGSQSFK
jgi:peptide chain release factor 3